MAPIRKGDGTPIVPKGIQQVRTGDGRVLFDGDAIPDSVVYQHDAATYTTGDPTWADSVGSADMAITGDPQSVALGGGDGVEGDGTNDHGLAPTQSLAENLTFGIAYTFLLPSISTRQAFFGVSDDGSGANRLTMFSGFGSTPGAVELDISDNNENTIRKYTDNTFDDGTAHSVVVNKAGNSAADISIYVDDMSTPAATTTASDQAFDNTNYAQTRELGYFARNNGGTVTDFMPVTFGVLEFNTEPYSESERDDFVSRRPEV